MSQGGPVRVRERVGRPSPSATPRITTQDRDNALFPLQAGPWARAVRRLRLQQLSIVVLLFTVVLVPIFLAVPSLNPVRLITGPGGSIGGEDPNASGGSLGGTDTTDIAVADATDLDRQLLDLIDTPDRYTQASAIPGIPTMGLSPICSDKPGASETKLAAAATVVLKSSTSASGVTITQTRGLFEAGGADSWLAEVRKNSCVNTEMPFPGYPEGAGLFRNQKERALAYFAAKTSDNTVLFLKVQSGSEDNAVSALSGTVLKIYNEAKEDSTKISLPTPSPTATTDTADGN